LLKPGMIGRVTLRLGALAKATLVPKDAIVVSGAQRQIAIFTPDPKAAPAEKGRGIVQILQVETGASDGAAIEVLGDVLKPGQLVVSQGNERLRPGQPVLATRTISTSSLVAPEPVK
jgi:multidrug efflux pump subunit AcrA (membrane-fusion protein)